MALDEAILEAAARKDSSPTLRLYAWSPPCISIGNAQPVSQIDSQKLNDFGWDIVRRSTGGRAILHTDELTYSICAPVDHPHFQGGVLPSYKNISAGLIAALELLGLDVQVHPEVNISEEERADPICFELPSSYEITVAGKKLVGSAQLRRRGGVLQHGTLPLEGDIGRISQVLTYSNDIQRQRSMQRVRDRATTVERLLGQPISWDEAARHVRKGFSDALNIQFAPDEPTKAERMRAEQLQAERFEGAEWLERV
jgi:lipoate-protein ligase A